MMSSPSFIDAIGVCHRPVMRPPRIVCLVPSITELLFELGLGTQIVGRTSYCVHPRGTVEAIPSVGGTKKVKHRMLRQLNPTHIIVNIDENTKPVVKQIAEYVPHIVVTHPLEPLDNFYLYRLMGGIFRREEQAERLCQRFEQALSHLRMENQDWPRRKVLYLIWRKPWMTVARSTYISRLLALVNWDTLPDISEPRYPTLEIDSILLEKTDLILLSSEPYRFKSEDLAAFSRQYSYPCEKLALIDGEMTSWYGSRAIRGLEYLRRFAAAHG
jgi:ABC-type Fe3+-hydroxamate transport system substrate-binding protein